MQDKRKTKEGTSLLGMNVRWFREKLKMTQGQLGEKLSYSKPWVSSVENGYVTDLADSALNDFAQHLSTSVEILTGTDDIYNAQLADIERQIRTRQHGPDIVNHLEKLLDEARNHRGPRAIAAVLRLLGNIKYISNQAEGALIFYDEGMTVSRKYEDVEAVHNLRLSKAKALSSMGQYEKALDQLAEIDFINRLKQYENFHLMGYIHCQINQWGSAEEALVKAIQLMEGATVSFDVKAECYQYLAVVYLNREDFSQAISCAERAIFNARLAQHELCEVYALRIQGDALLNIGKTVDATTILQEALQRTNKENELERLELQFLLLHCEENALGNYKNMQQVVTKIEKINPHPRSIAKLYNRLKKIAFRLKKFGDAEEYSDKAFHYMQLI